jgi:hypothetical protein
MLPQTNLQLYRVMIDAGATNEALAMTRAAYDLAREIFPGCYRPSHKPFICHLVGTAGALATWGEPPHVIGAGLLHSAYLFGNLGDGSRGMNAGKRKIVAGRVGVAAEALIAAYTEQSWSGPLDQFVEAVRTGACTREVMLLKLADTYDECIDAGPRFAPQKQLSFGLPDNAEACASASGLVAILCGQHAREQFAAVLEATRRFTAPAPLVTNDRSFHVVSTAGEPPRRRIRLRLRRLADAWGRKRAA